MLLDATIGMVEATEEALMTKATRLKLGAALLLTAGALHAVGTIARTIGG